MTDIQWGPEIMVEGKRLDIDLDATRWQYRSHGTGWYQAGGKASDYRWHDDFDLIRLPANHPHYAQQTRVQPGRQTIGNSDNLSDLGSRAQQAPTPDVGGIAPELVERMVALVRRIAAKSELKPEFPDMVSFINELIADARGIAGMVEPIDKDEALAIELVGSLEEWGFNNLHRKAHDLALAAIRRGRALERGEA